MLLSSAGGNGISFLRTANLITLLGNTTSARVLICNALLAGGLFVDLCLAELRVETTAGHDSINPIQEISSIPMLEKAGLGTHLIRDLRGVVDTGWGKWQLGRC